MSKVSNLPEEYIKLDGMAKDMKNRLNIYDLLL